MEPTQLLSALSGAAAYAADYSAGRGGEGGSGHSIGGGSSLAELAAGSSSNGSASSVLGKHTTDSLEYCSE